MKCQHVKVLLDEFNEKGLDDTLYLQVKGHLSSCRKCSSDFEFLKSLSVYLKNADPIEPSPDFIEKLNNRIEKEAIENHTIALLNWKTIAVAAGLAAVSILYFLFSFSDTKHSSTNYAARSNDPGSHASDISHVASTEVEHPSSQSVVAKKESEEKRVEKIVAKIPETKIVKSSANSPDLSRPADKPIELGLLLNYERRDNLAFNTSGNEVLSGEMYKKIIAEEKNKNQLAQTIRILTDLKEIIEANGGTYLNFEAGPPPYLKAEIPKAHIDDFVERLHLFGKIQKIVSPSMSSTNSAEWDHNNDAFICVQVIINIPAESN